MAEAVRSESRQKSQINCNTDKFIGHPPNAPACRSRDSRIVIDLSSRIYRPVCAISFDSMRRNYNPVSSRSRLFHPFSRSFVPLGPRSLNSTRLNNVILFSRQSFVFYFAFTFSFPRLPLLASGDYSRARGGTKKNSERKQSCLPASSFSASSPDCRTVL